MCRWGELRASIGSRLSVEVRLAWASGVSGGSYAVCAIKSVIVGDLLAVVAAEHTKRFESLSASPTGGGELHLCSGLCLGHDLVRSPVAAAASAAWPGEHFATRCPGGARVLFGVLGGGWKLLEDFSQHALVVVSHGRESSRHNEEVKAPLQVPESLTLAQGWGTTLESL